MAEIKRFPVLRHIRADNGFHLLHFKNGRLRRSGRGLSFWFLPMSASMAEIPVADQSVTFAFSLKTSDLQDVSVQGALNWRVSIENCSWILETEEAPSSELLHLGTNQDL